MTSVLYDFDWKHIGIIEDGVYYHGSSKYYGNHCKIWYIPQTKLYILTKLSQLLFSDPNLESVIMWGLMNDTSN